MGARIQRITPMLWFDTEAEDAVRFYTSIFPNSRIGHVSRYGAENAKLAGRKADSVMTVSFDLDGQPFTALNGGPIYKFTEAISFVVNCESQAEIDHYWSKLTAGGDEKSQQCGWLKDKFGVTWQIVPANIVELITGKDAAKSSRALHALLSMKKIEIAKLENA
jgi:predicted 3-demethylubiquinone-9 3-methyltransferase (glyoxalase superfamily)